MQDIQLRYRRQDRTLRIGAVAFMLTIAGVMAAPLLLPPQPADPRAVALFEPHRTIAGRH